MRSAMLAAALLIALWCTGKGDRQEWTDPCQNQFIPEAMQYCYRALEGQEDSPDDQTDSHLDHHQHRNHHKILCCSVLGGVECTHFVYHHFNCEDKTQLHTEIASLLKASLGVDFPHPKEHCPGYDDGRCQNHLEKVQQAIQTVEITYPIAGGSDHADVPNSIAEDVRRNVSHGQPVFDPEHLHFFETSLDNVSRSNSSSGSRDQRATLQLVESKEVYLLISEKSEPIIQLKYASSAEVNADLGAIEKKLGIKRNQSEAAGGLPLLVEWEDGTRAGLWKLKDDKAILLFSASEGQQGSLYLASRYCNATDYSQLMNEIRRLINQQNSTLVYHHEENRTAEDFVDNRQPKGIWANSFSNLFNISYIQRNWHEFVKFFTINSSHSALPHPIISPKSRSFVFCIDCTDNITGSFRNTTSDETSFNLTRARSLEQGENETLLEIHELPCNDSIACPQDGFFNFNNSREPKEDPLDESTPFTEITTELTTPGINFTEATTELTTLEYTDFTDVTEFYNFTDLVNFTDTTDFFNVTDIDDFTDAYSFTDLDESQQFIGDEIFDPDSFSQDRESRTFRVLDNATQSDGNFTDRTAGARAMIVFATLQPFRLEPSMSNISFDEVHPVFVVNTSNQDSDRAARDFPIVFIEEDFVGQIARDSRDLNASGIKWYSFGNSSADNGTLLGDFGETFRGPKFTNQTDDGDDVNGSCTFNCREPKAQEDLSTNSSNANESDSYLDDSGSFDNFTEPEDCEPTPNFFNATADNSTLYNVSDQVRSSRSNELDVESNSSSVALPIAASGNGSDSNSSDADNGGFRQVRFVISNCSENCSEIESDFNGTRYADLNSTNESWEVDQNETRQQRSWFEEWLAENDESVVDNTTSFSSRPDNASESLGNFSREHRSFDCNSTQEDSAIVICALVSNATWENVTSDREQRNIDDLLPYLPVNETGNFSSPNTTREARGSDDVLEVLDTFNSSSPTDNSTSSNSTREARGSDKIGDEFDLFNSSSSNITDDGTSPNITREARDSEEIVGVLKNFTLLSDNSTASNFTREARGSDEIVEIIENFNSSANVTNSTSPDSTREARDSEEVGFLKNLTLSDLSDNLTASNFTREARGSDEIVEIIDNFNSSSNVSSNSTSPNSTREARGSDEVVDTLELVNSSSPNGTYNSTRNARGNDEIVEELDNLNCSFTVNSSLPNSTRDARDFEDILDGSVIFNVSSPNITCNSSAPNDTREARDFEESPNSTFANSTNSTSQIVHVFSSDSDRENRNILEEWFPEFFPTNATETGNSSALNDTRAARDFDSTFANSTNTTSDRENRNFLEDWFPEFFPTATNASTNETRESRYIIDEQGDQSNSSNSTANSVDLEDLPLNRTHRAEKRDLTSFEPKLDYVFDYDWLNKARGYIYNYSLDLNAYVIHASEDTKKNLRHLYLKLNRELSSDANIKPSGNRQARSDSSDDLIRFLHELRNKSRFGSDAIEENLLVNSHRDARANELDSSSTVSSPFGHDLFPFISFGDRPSTNGPNTSSAADPEDVVKRVDEMEHGFHGQPGHLVTSEGPEPTANSTDRHRHSGTQLRHPADSVIVLVLLHVLFAHR